MAICPDHGAYSGNSCRLCTKEVEVKRKPDFVPPDPVDQNKIGEIQSSTSPYPGRLSAPGIEIDIHDKYLLSRAHSEFLNAHIKTVQAQESERASQDNLRNITKTVFEKMNLDPKEWILDIEKMQLIKRDAYSDLNKS